MCNNERKMEFGISCSSEEVNFCKKREKRIENSPVLLIIVLITTINYEIRIKEYLVLVSVYPNRRCLTYIYIYIYAGGLCAAHPFSNETLAHLGSV